MVLISHILRDALAFEVSTSNAIDCYPAAIEQKLRQVIEHPAMEILKVVHASFDNWPTTVCRAGKLETARMFAERLEHFIVDNGQASAGKTYLQTVGEFTLGSYACQIKEELMTKEPPSADSPSPATLEMRGRRQLSSPELERTKKIRSSWIKKLADPSSEWTARVPFAKEEVKFRVFGMLNISSNNGVEFTRMDVGVSRRAIACPYRYKFCSAPDPNNPEEKAWLKDDQGAAVEIKSQEWIMGRVAGWIYWLMCMHSANWQDGNKGIGRLPRLIQEETEAVLRMEIVEHLRAWLEDKVMVCPPAEGMTKPEIMKIIKFSGDLTSSFSVQELSAGLDMIVEVAPPQNGRRNLVRLRDSKRFIKPRV